MMEEVNGLIKHCVFKVAKKRKVHFKANVHSCKFVSAIKSEEGKDEGYRAKLVIRGQRDRHKLYMVHSLQKVQPSPALMLLANSVIQDFELWLINLKQAYVHTKARLHRKVYILGTSAEFGIKDDECL